MQSFTPDPSDKWIINYQETGSTTVQDSIAGWAVCAHNDEPEVHPAVIYEGRALALRPPPSGTSGCHG